MKYTLQLFGIFLFAFYAQGTVLRVNNNSNSGADYTDLQTAIDAASAGDTLVVAGSLTAYGTVNEFDTYNITISKKVILIGAGYSSAKGQLVSLLGNVKVVDGGEGSEIRGFFFNANKDVPGQYSINALRIQTSKITVAGNYLHAVFLGQGSPDIEVSNCSIIQNNFRAQDVYSNGGIVVYYGTNLIIANNVVPVIVGTSLKSNNCIVRNNIVFGGYVNGSATLTVYNSDIKNNILLTEISNNSTQTAFRFTTNSWYNNLFAYGTSALNDAQANQFGVNMDLVFKNTTNSTIDSVYVLGSASPAIGAGYKAEDCGIYSGRMPYQPGGISGLPRIRRLQLSNDNTGNINITSK